MRGNATARSFEVNGTVDKDPLAGCEFRSDCPSPSAPHDQPCEAGLFAAEKWAKGLDAGGHPRAMIDDDHLLVDLHTPADYDAMGSSDPTACRADPSSTENIGLDAFTAPVAFKGNPPPPVNSRKLIEYNEARSPSIRLGLRGQTWRLLSNDQFNVNCHWTARWAQPGQTQVGPDYSQLLDLTSRIEKIEVRGLS